MLTRFCRVKPSKRRKYAKKFVSTLTKRNVIRRNIITRSAKRVKKTRNGINYTRQNGKKTKRKTQRAKKVLIGKNVEEREPLATVFICLHK